MSSNDIAIRVHGLSKCYGIYANPRDRLKQFILPRLQRLIGQTPKQYFREFWALKDVSFEIKRGETVGIIGRNGSGKSTLLQMICGTLNPTSGSIQTNGRIAALLELGSGFNPEFTGRENVYMNASVLGLSNEEIDARFDDIVAFADIGDFIEQPVKTYSSGMMVRLAFAVIAHVDADILVVDEALAVGDAFFTQKCMRFLRKFMKNGTVLFVSHDTDGIKNLCNYAVWIEKGQVIQEGAPKDVCELYLEAFYEVQQGKGSATKLREYKKLDDSTPLKDQRLEFINASNLRNDLKVFEFDPDAPAFGTGRAEITNVQFTDATGTVLSWVVGGEEVTLTVESEVNDLLCAPIVGFYIKDRLGQTLFGDNTYLSYLNKKIESNPGTKLIAKFTFCMPYLPKGMYSVAVGVANGSQDTHTMELWIHDAVIFQSENQRVAVGLIGIPMQSILLHQINFKIKDQV
jgi:lipopolysaccharide transport system ATP-binding protein